MTAATCRETSSAGDVLASFPARPPPRFEPWTFRNSTTAAQPFVEKDRSLANPTLSKLPVVTICVADTGVTLKGLLDSGAAICCMSLRAAIRAKVMPWDGEASARTANGNEMACYGIANGVRIFVDGFEQLVDFLVCDLGAGLDFLLGWDYLQHYEGWIDPATGALRAKDVNGQKFVSASRFQYTSMAGAVTASVDGKDAEHSEVSHKKVTRQLQEIDEIEDLEQRLYYAKQVYNVRLVETHTALSESNSSEIQSMMQGKWKDHKCFMEEVNADKTEIWSQDQTLQSVQESLQAAAATVKQYWHRTEAAKTAQVNAVMKGVTAKTEELMTWKTVGNMFGQVVGKVMSGFYWTRSVLNQSNEPNLTQ